MTRIGAFAMPAMLASTLIQSLPICDARHTRLRPGSLVCEQLFDCRVASVNGGERGTHCRIAT